jgi:hypothetical protein
MAFFQDPPRLGNQFDDDPLLPSWLERSLGPAAGEIAGELRARGDLAVECYGKQLADLPNEPVLVQWDAWGQRIDRIEVSPLWREAQVLAARHGMVAAGYEPRLGAGARTHQFAIAHVLGPSLDVYSCPLAMTDGAARTLLASGDRALIDRYVPRLVSRDPAPRCEPARPRSLGGRSPQRRRSSAGAEQPRARSSAPTERARFAPSQRRARLPPPPSRASRCPARCPWLR